MPFGYRERFTQRSPRQHQVKANARGRQPCRRSDFEAVEPCVIMQQDRCALNRRERGEGRIEINRVTSVEVRLLAGERVETLRVSATAYRGKCVIDDYLVAPRVKGA